MKKYVILKQIDGVWYATRNRYTKKELNDIAWKKFKEDDVEYSRIDNGESFTLAYKVIVVLDDGRKLNDGIYLNDNLDKEDEVEKGLIYLGVLLVPIWMFTSMSIDMLIGLMFAWVLFAKFVLMPMTKKQPSKNNLPDDHETTGMMKGAKF